jgi:hypothetical protein
MVERALAHFEDTISRDIIMHVSSFLWVLSEAMTDLRVYEFIRSA